MAKPRDKDEERAVDLDVLEPTIRQRAFDLGFRKPASINKVLREIEHEKWAKKLCLGFVALMSAAALAAFGARFVVHEERRGQLLLVGLFAAAWALGAWAFGKRAEKRLVWGEELLLIVKEKLGK